MREVHLMQKDPTIIIHIPIGYDGMELQDLRTRCRIGALKECSGQYGIPMSKSGEVIELKAKRGRMQKFMELLHFSGLPYTVIS